MHQLRHNAWWKPITMWYITSHAELCGPSLAGPRAQAVQHMLNMPPEQLATWVLYSFSYLALPPDKLMPDIPTELQARTLNTSYVISASSSPPNLVSPYRVLGLMSVY